MLILTLPLHEKGLHSESFFRCKIKSCPNYMPSFTGQLVKEEHILGKLFMYVFLIRDQMELVPQL